MLVVAIDGDVSASPEERRSLQLSCSSHRGDDHQTAFEVVGYGSEMDLDGSLGQPSPSHATKAVASLPGSEDFLDPATDPMDRLLSVSLKE